MPNPEVIGSKRSSYTRVVRMACEEKGIDYVFTEALLGAPEIFAIHPFGKMPVMRHGDVELFESKAIATYFDRSFPGPSLFPSEPVPAALVEQWVPLVNTLVDPLDTDFAWIRSPTCCPDKTADGKPDRQAIEAVTPFFREQIEVLQKAVARTGYLAGDQFTFADINLMPILYYMRLVPEGAEALGRATHLAAYYGRHAERPSFKSTIPPEGPPRRSAAS